MASRPPASEAGAYPGSATSARGAAGSCCRACGSSFTRPAAKAAAAIVRARDVPCGEPQAGRSWPGAAPAWAVPRPVRGGDASPPPLCLEGRSRRPPLSASAAGEVGGELRRRAVGVAGPDLATALLEATLAGEEADDLVLRLGRGRHQRERRRYVTRAQARHAGDGAAGHRAGHIECEQQPLACGLDVAERGVERGVERVDDLAYRVPLATTAGTATGRV